MTQNNMDVVAFLKEAARYFANRDTGGEDRAHWANVYNSETCLKAAEALTSAQAEIATQKQANEALMRERANIIETKREQLARLTARAEAAEKERDALLKRIEEQRVNFAGLTAVQDALNLIRPPTTGAKE